MPQIIFKSENSKLYLGNYLEVLKKYGDNSFNCIFADPPYLLSNNGFTWHSSKRVSVQRQLGYK